MRSSSFKRSKMRRATDWSWWAHTNIFLSFLQSSICRGRMFQVFVCTSSRVNCFAASENIRRPPLLLLFFSFEIISRLEAEGIEGEQLILSNNKERLIRPRRERQKLLEGLFFRYTFFLLPLILYLIHPWSSAFASAIKGCLTDLKEEEEEKTWWMLLQDGVSSQRLVLSIVMAGPAAAETMSYFALACVVVVALLFQSIVCTIRQQLMNWDETDRKQKSFSSSSYLYSHCAAALWISKWIEYRFIHYTGTIALPMYPVRIIIIIIYR